ncbi:MAG: hypothetical protein ABSE51_16950 [Terracidiphilus sp.]|jgi:predicted PhzF superfamily epimerase YddE/YHI9
MPVLQYVHLNVFADQPFTGNPSRIHISLPSRPGVLEEVQVGGEAVVVGEGTIRA